MALMSSWLGFLACLGTSKTENKEYKINCSSSAGVQLEPEATDRLTESHWLPLLFLAFQREGSELLKKTHERSEIKKPVQLERKLRTGLNF
jgi:hypothetical protein